MHYAGNLVDRRKCWILQIRGGVAVGRGSRHGMICAPAWRPASHTSPAHYTTLVHIIPHLYTLLCTCIHHTTLVHSSLHLYTSYHTCTHFSALVYVIPHLYTLYFTCTHHTILACTMPHLLCAHNAPLLCSSFQRAANQLRTRTSDTWQMHSRFPLHSVFTLSSKA